jgi:hypothetical protein
MICPVCGSKNIHKNQHLSNPPYYAVCDMYNSVTEVYDDEIIEYVCGVNRSHVFYVSIWSIMHSLSKGV